VFTIHDKLERIRPRFKLDRSDRKQQKPQIRMSPNYLELSLRSKSDMGVLDGAGQAVFEGP
jgi:thymidylate kinase